MCFKMGFASFSSYSSATSLLILNPFHKLKISLLSLFFGSNPIDHTSLLSLHSNHKFNGIYFFYYLGIAWATAYIVKKIYKRKVANYKNIGTFLSKMKRNIYCFPINLSFVFCAPIIIASCF